MKITTVIAACLILACLQTAHAQSTEAQKENCCPVTDAGGRILDPCFENYQRALIRAEAVGLLSQFKTLVTEIYLNSGAWPIAGDPTYVSAPTSYAQNWISRFDLLANGLLSVTLNRHAGSGSITMRPIVSTDPNIPPYWKCESPDQPLIGQLVPGCTYSGTPL
jgi:hypothetical protein